MPRFFFHIRDENGCITDHNGQDLPNIDAAHYAALKAAEEFWDDLSFEIAREIRSIEITDEEHHRLLIVPVH